MRTVNSARNPVWADPTGYRIDLEVDFDELDEVYVPFTAAKRTENTADYEYSHDLFERALAGEFGPIGDYVPRSNITGEDALQKLRRERTEMLAETDYVENITYWNSLTEAQQIAWTSYRQALRDLPQTVVDPVYINTFEVDSGQPWNYTYTTVPDFDYPVKPE